MTPDERYALALRDADDEPTENLQAASDIYDRIIKENNTMNDATPVTTPNCSCRGEIVGEEATTEHLMEAHTETISTFTCTACDRDNIFRSIEDFTDHVTDEHMEESESAQCVLCEHVCEEDEMEEHMIDDHTTEVPAAQCFHPGCDESHIITGAN